MGCVSAGRVLSGLVAYFVSCQCFGVTDMWEVRHDKHSHVVGSMTVLLNVVDCHCRDLFSDRI